MTMAHRAFAFDYAAFNDELWPVLLAALEGAALATLHEWIEANLRSSTRAGKARTFFQTVPEVRSALERIQALLQLQPALAPDLAPLQGMFQQAARHNRGLYVTF